MSQSPDPAAGPSLTLAPEGAPNVVLVLLDDVGFGASAPFGGLIETPAIAELADSGVRTSS